MIAKGSSIRNIGACLAALTILAISSVAISPLALAQPAPHCQPDQIPQFALGFASLKNQVGEAMGSPMSCEYSDPNGTGDTLQTTSTGLAFWRKTTNTPTFTDGSTHWATTPSGLVTWTGTSIDPPVASTGVLQLNCALIIYDPNLPAHSTTFESCTGGPYSVDLHDVNGYKFANVFVLPDVFGEVAFANVSRQLVQLPVDIPALAGKNLLIERDQDGMFNVSVISS